MSNINVVDVSLRSAEEWVRKLGEKYHFTDNEDLMLELVAAFNMFAASNEQPPVTQSQAIADVKFTEELCVKNGVDIAINSPNTFGTPGVAGSVNVITPTPPVPQRGVTFSDAMNKAIIASVGRGKCMNCGGYIDCLSCQPSLPSPSDRERREAVIKQIYGIWQNNCTDISWYGKVADWHIETVAGLRDKETHRLRAYAQEVNGLQSRLAELERERDLAVAHDRQSYPTAEAYEAVCAARNKWQQRAEAAESQVAVLRAAQIGIYTSAIIRKDNKFLLTRHLHIGPPVWLMPGGKPETHESAKECLIRECREELNIELEGLKFHGAYLNEMNGREWVGLFFDVESFSGTPQIQETAKHSHMAWLTFQEMCIVACGQPEMGISKYLAALTPSPESTEEKSKV